MRIPSPSRRLRCIAGLVLLACIIMGCSRTVTRTRSWGTDPAPVAQPAP